MAKRVIDESTLISLADAVRAMTGITDPLTLDDMIRHIQEASGSVTTNTADGNPIQIADCMTRKLHGLTIYGKTIQNGTPSPSAPVALNSAGADGNIIVNVDTQTLNVFTPYGLPGIPVPSDGNYTDASGQQWLGDEIDFARGKYVQRVGKIKFGDLEWSYQTPQNRFVSGEIPNILYKDNALRHKTVLSNKFSTDTSGLDGTIYQNGYAMVAYCNSHSGLEDFVDTQADAELYYILANPVETDLAVEELEAYSVLHTNYPQTLIHNDAGAWMSVKYVVDVATEADYQDALREMGVDV